MIASGQPVAKEYVEKLEGVFRIIGTRVSLDSLVYCFREGLSPESIAESFPALTLEQIYGAITFYLANQEFVDQYMQKGEECAAQLATESRSRNAELISRLLRARHESQMPG
ncbi:MAG: DUF433 domain-containing protein [Acidobacteria bacterium]|nr:DUF433 domain-containing protein [Acidobacteriota bacterium]MBI3280822.1 DUF433 domain-containing protein [Acidobacteriota bacterium]